GEPSPPELPTRRADFRAITGIDPSLVALIETFVPHGKLAPNAVRRSNIGAALERLLTRRADHADATGLIDRGAFAGMREPRGGIDRFRFGLSAILGCGFVVRLGLALGGLRHEIEAGRDGRSVVGLDFRHLDGCRLARWRAGDSHDNA